MLVQPVANKTSAHACPRGHRVSTENQPAYLKDLDVEGQRAVVLPTDQALHFGSQAARIQQVFLNTSMNGTAFTVGVSIRAPLASS
jgi:hypothetical protein